MVPNLGMLLGGISEGELGLKTGRYKQLKHCLRGAGTGKKGQRSTDILE